MRATATEQARGSKLGRELAQRAARRSLPLGNPENVVTCSSEAAWLCSVQFPSLQQRLKTQMQQTAGHNGKGRYNAQSEKTRRTQGKWWPPSLTHQNQDGKICPRAWVYSLISSCLLPLQMPRLQTEQSSSAISLSLRSILAASSYFQFACLRWL